MKLKKDKFFKMNRSIWGYRLNHHSDLTLDYRLSIQNHIELLRGEKSNFKNLYSSQDKNINDTFLMSQLLVAFDGLALERLLWIFLFAD